MTVAALTSSISYLENGVTLAFPAPFRFLTGGLLVDRVLTTGAIVTLVLGVDYTVSGGTTDTGGTVTLVASVSGATLRIRRVTPRAQMMNYTPGDTFPAESHEAALDRSMLIDQEQDRRIDDTTLRALLVPDGETATPLPAAAARANKFAAFDALGRVIAAAGTGADAGLRDDLAASGGVGLIGNAAQYVESMAALAAATPFIKHAKLTDPLRGLGNDGWVLRNASDYTALIAADTLRGLTQPSSVDATKVWVRVWNLIDGHPEWFGAVTGGPDCLAALRACVALCPVTRTRSADYFISAKWEINTAFRAVRGPVNSDGFDTGRGTRIVSNNGAQDVCRVGPVSVPSTSDGCLRGMVIEGVSFQHGVTPTVPSVGSEKTAVANLRCEYLIDARIANNCAQEPVIGFVFHGLIGSHIEGNRAFRASRFAEGNDVFIGFLTTGSAPSGLGILGNNASLYWDRNNASLVAAALTLDPSRRMGFWHTNDIADQFWEKHEALGCGIKITGSGETSAGFTNQDCRLVSPVVDQYDGIAYDISDIAKNGSLRIYDIYSGQPAGILYAVRLQNIGGAVIIKGGDMLATPNNISIAVSYESSDGVLEIDGVIMHDFARPIGINNSKHFDIKAKVVCHNNTPTSGTYAAVSLINAQIGKIAVSVVGKTAAYEQGVVTFDALCDKLQIDATLIDPACINGGAANKIVANSAVQLNAPGNYTPAGAAGTPGAGILVHGITA